MHNEALTMHTTQAKYSDMIFAILKIPAHEHHYQVLLMEENIKRYILNLGKLVGIAFALPFSMGFDTCGLPYLKPIYRKIAGYASLPGELVYICSSDLKAL